MKINSGEGQIMSFNLFPNPTPTNINLEVFCRESYVGKNITITILDVMGREWKIETQTLSDVYAVYEVTGMETFPQGLYIVKINLVGHVYYLSLMKNE
jgi:hypothetical protein